MSKKVSPSPKSTLIFAFTRNKSSSVQFELSSTAFGASAGVPHHLLSIIDPSVEFTCRDFRHHALPVSICMKLLMQIRFSVLSFQ
jgi:hypothetical protein